MAASTIVIKHYPLSSPLCIALLMSNLLWGFFELVMWAGILVGANAAGHSL